MNAITTHRRRRCEAGFRRVEIQARADDVERVRRVAHAFMRDDEVAKLLRRHIDRELAAVSRAHVSALEALQMPEDQEIADMIEAIVAERSLDQVRDLEW